MLIFLIVIGRFVYIAQGREIDGHELTQIGEKQWTKVDVIDKKRGTIYSNDGQVFAKDVPAYTLVAVLSEKADNHVKDIEKTAQALAPILDLKVSDVRSTLEKDAYQVEFGSAGKKLSLAQKKKIEQLKLPGLTFVDASKRTYPEQSSAAFTIGFTQTDPETDKEKGVLGIEQSLDRYLSEKDGTVSYYRSIDGVPIPGETRHLKDAAPGNDVYLTLNSWIQAVLDQSMSSVYEEYKPESMLAVVADPETGRILGMSSKPDFNLNERDTIDNFTNAPVQSRYEPGSVMKMFTLSAAIDAGVYRGQGTFNSGTYRFDGGTVHDWNRKGWGTITFDQGFQLSSNVAMSIIADQQLGTDRLKSYLDKFGFMEPTGIDLPGEASSVINWSSKMDQIAPSFGQGSAFTAMQIVQAATAIANDGTMMRPYIVDRIVNPETDKTVLQHDPQVAGKPISKEAAEETRRLMRQVVSNKDVARGYGGTGLAYDLPGYDLIGKTGTSQLYLNGKLMTGRNNYIYSFLGMAPEKDPKVMVYVAVRQPKLKDTDVLSSQPVIDVFKPVMSSSLQYVNAARSDDKKGETAVPSAVFDSFVGQSVDEAVETLKKKGFDPVAIGGGTVKAQMPYEGQKMVEGSKIILLGSDSPKMPDLTGWSLADSLKVAEVAGLRTSVKGDGYVIAQTPDPGSAVKSGMQMTLQMGKPEDKEEEAAAQSKSVVPNPPEADQP